MAPVNRNQRPRKAFAGALTFALALLLALPLVRAQSAGTPAQPQAPANSQSDQNIPDAPSTVQPPPPKPEPPAPQPDAGRRESGPDQSPAQDSGRQSGNPPPPPMPPVQTIPPGTAPRNQINPAEGLYTFRVITNFVLLPVMVKDSDGRRVDGLLPKDFTVNENGKPQKLTYFTSDPFELSVAIVLDTGMADVALQKLNQTYSALVAAFSPYDEVALYTYSSTVSQASDFSQRSDKLMAVLNEIKVERGSNGPPVLNGPLANGPTVNGAPVGGPVIQPVYTPPREFHVLNDAILRAALDLGKREKTRRKVIFVISDGQELGSKASYKDVLRVLQTRDIQVKAIVVDSGALPIFRQVERLRLKGQGYSDILPKYVSATGGGQPYDELSRNAIEDAYTSITTDARNQYTLGYVPQATTGSSAYRSVEVIVHRKGLKISAKAGYYPTGSVR